MVLVFWGFYLRRAEEVGAGVLVWVIWYAEMPAPCVFGIFQKFPAFFQGIYWPNAENFNVQKFVLEIAFSVGNGTMANCRPKNNSRFVCHGSKFYV